MKPNIFLVSNMYPSEEDRSYGIFVKNFEVNALKQGINVSCKAVIKGKGKTAIEKVIKYIKFYISILFVGARGNYDLIYAHYITHSAFP
jgi:L-malate glycosyltransferase